MSFFFALLRVLHNYSPVAHVGQKFFACFDFVQSLVNITAAMIKLDTFTSQKQSKEQTRIISSKYHNLELLRLPKTSNVSSIGNVIMRIKYAI